MFLKCNDVYFPKIKKKNQCQGPKEDTVGCLTEIWAQHIIITIYIFVVFVKENLKFSCLWLHNE